MNKITENRFMRFCNMIVTIIMVILTGYLFLLSIFNTCLIDSFYYEEQGATCFETTAYLTDSPLFHISVIVLFFLLGYLLISHLRLPSQKIIKRLLLGIHMIMALVMLISIFTYNYFPVYDQKAVVSAAYNLLHSNYDSWKSFGYNNFFPWLNSFILFLVPEIFLFGVDGGIIAFRIINLGMLILASYSLYGFCKETKQNSTATSIFFILYLPIELYVFFVYGNIACMSLSLFAIWMAVRYLNHNQTRDVILCAFALSFAALFKDNALIAMVAVLIVFAVYGITARHWKQLLWIPVIILVYIGCSFTVDTVMEKITGEPVSDSIDIYGHLTMGISESAMANGWFNNYTVETFKECNYDFALYQTVAKEEFMRKAETFFSDPSYASHFLVKKTASQWSNPTFQSTWIIQYMIMFNAASGIDSPVNPLFIDGSVANTLYTYFYNLIQSMIFFGCLIYFIFESRKAPLSSLIPAITFIGGFLFLLFWEGKAQYSLIFFMMLFPYAVSGLIYLMKAIIHLTKSKDKEWYRSGEIIFLGLSLCIILLLSFSDFKIINNTVKLGCDDDYYYNEYLEENFNFIHTLLQLQGGRNEQ